VVHPKEFTNNDGARPGDRLILTKPIGSGIMANAAKEGKISQEVFGEAIAVMIELNAAAAKVARLVNAHAVTDITGFGLVGHAFQMAEASAVAIEIFASRVPTIGPTLSLAAAGVTTRAWKSTLESIGGGFQARGIDDAMVRVLADAQTSGGLMMSVAPDRVATALSELNRLGVKAAREIGIVKAGQPAVFLMP
jgi:selenide,water dikinase